MHRSATRAKENGAEDWRAQSIGKREPLVATVSIVERTMGEARRSMALALAGAVLIVGGLVAEQFWFSAMHEIASNRLARAEQLAGDIRLADQRLTSTAQMVASTGQRHWIDIYDSHLPELAEALAQARALAPPAASQRFDAQTRELAVVLGDMREAAFEAANVGAADAARAIFESDRYRHHIGLMSAAAGAFAAATVDATHADVNALRRRTALASICVLLGALVMGTALWRRLSSRLERSRDYFLDAENRIQHLACSDVLTGLGNRVALQDAMTTAIARAERDGHRLVVLMLDLDHFKPVNDRHGHMVGDLVLKEVANRLRLCLRGGEIQARYGGDEFVVAIDEANDASVARTVANRIVQNLAQPMAIDELQISIGVSIGIARYPDDADGSDGLLRKADSALYRAKANGRGGVCFYDRSLDEQLAERETLQQQMRDGIALGEFVPYYQPIVQLASREVQSLELLCRWNHPTQGLLTPVRFIPLAEACGLIGPMLLSVLRQACGDLPQFPANWRLSVNVAPQQILDSTLVPQLLAVLSENNIPPARLDVELTETALVTDTARAREVMKAMRVAGISVTLDDFGTGYSSLSYLAEMPFDKIKIDQSFVRTLHERAESAKIVDAVIGLSRSLGVQTVAEGVETQRDAEVLLQLGCELAQGYLFGRPMPARQVIEAVAARVLTDGPGVDAGIAASC